MKAHVLYRQSRPTALLHCGLAGLCFCLAAACSGDSDGSVGVGSGQDPDPVTVDFPIAYTKGPLFDADMQMQMSADLRSLDRFNVGTDLYLRDQASPSAAERNVTFEVTQGLGDVMGVEISSDGDRVLFAMRGPFDENLSAEDQPTWNIWEYDIELGSLRRIIASDILAEGGHDIFPHYLPDGRIVFSSTRQRTAKAILLDEGKPQFEAFDENRNEPASVLHIMNDDGSDLRQISFNQSHDFSPTVLDNGQVLYSRWDRPGSVNGIHLYRVNPDGTALELLYGAESHRTGTDGASIQFVDAHEMMDGRILSVVRPFVHPELGGDLVAIDVGTYVENTQPTAANAGMPGPAQTSVTTNEVRTDDLPSRGGRFSSAFPLWDGTDRVLVTWSNCRLVVDTVITACSDETLADPNAVPAPPLYGVWMYDPADGTQLPIVSGEEGVLVSDVVAAQPRHRPTIILDQVAGGALDPDLVAENVGILNIRSVYDIDGAAVGDIAAIADPATTMAADRPFRFLRVERAVGIPDPDLVALADTAFGPNVRQGMREIVAYAPIEPDGSVRLKVPANVPLAVSVLDERGRRVSQRHQNWLQVQPGEEARCNGCHIAGSGLSHGRLDSFLPAYSGAPTTGVPFPNTTNAFVPDFGETMAETRTRVSCQTDCNALTPTLDLVYDDVWTDPAVRTPDASFAYTYAALSTPPPAQTQCGTAWTRSCRSVINYEQHIHPLWTVQRQIDVLSGGILVPQDVTCASGGCHAPFDALNNAALPAAQLDLSDGLSPVEMDHFISYRELLFEDDGLPAPMSAAGATDSDAFFSKFDTNGTHAGYLTPDELRLIAEWLDIGAQYYNNPFDVPVN